MIITTLRAIDHPKEVFTIVPTEVSLTFISSLVGLMTQELA
jgi:hypothetical protein